MQFDPNDFTRGDRDAVSVFIDHITRSEEKQEEEQEGGTRKTEVKVFLTNNKGLEIGGLTDAIQNRVEEKDLHQYVQRFFGDHNIHEEVLEEGQASYVEIDTPKKGRTDQFVFIADDDYLRILTAERRKWTKKTVEKLIQYLPHLERVFLTPSDLEEVVDDLYGTSISGFTAKNYNFGSEKHLSMRFHGGDEKDLQKVDQHFDAKPTRLEFDQRNSPSAAVGSSVAQEGHFSFDYVRPGSEERGRQTLEELSEDIQEHDRRNYSIENEPKRTRIKSGFKFEGFTTLALVDSEDGSDREIVTDTLEEEILDRKRRYEYSVWEHGKFYVFDKDTDSPFEVTVEEGEIRLHAKEGAQASAFRDFCELVFEEFDTTYSLNKHTAALTA